MRIVIDMQGAQTESRFRGIGRYALSLAKAIIRNKGEHEVLIVLNGMFTESVDELEQLFSTLLPKENVLVWYAPGPVNEHAQGNDWRREVAECIREAFLASLCPDVVLITSLFEGYLDDAVTSIGKFSEDVRTAVILYDLIPLLNSETYLANNSTYAKHYGRKIDFLKKASMYLAISKAAANEGRELLALPSDRIFKIATACEPVFQPININQREKNDFLKKFDIKGPFVLYAGGSDSRKNLNRLILAFAALPRIIRDKHQLVLAGKMPLSDINRIKQSAKAVGLRSDKVVFTGYVSDAELALFYNTCSVFVLPSLHEGFGLPALEAMACGAAVIGSNSTSIPEVIGLETALFNPLSVADISEKLTKVLLDETFMVELRNHGLKQAKNFTWDECAIATLTAFESTKANTSHSNLGWSAIKHIERKNYSSLIKLIAQHCLSAKGISDYDIRCIAGCLEKNEGQFRRITYRQNLPQALLWRMEGPFDSTYSLALVNRELARGLAALGHDVALHSTEGHGDFAPGRDFLENNKDALKFYERAKVVTQSMADVCSRNLYPPRVADMDSNVNLLHSYGWEESGFPSNWVDSFNLNLQGLTVMSEHVRKVMIDNGVSVPIAVAGIGVDHWDRIVADKHFKLVGKTFRFLHVSSCFPRKGVDCLLKAYGKAFTSDDDVTLIIKTFSNPHNKIDDWLKSVKRDNPKFPDVQILEGDFSDSTLKALYEQCHVLVAPSRAEGFGLPLAEAMLSGLAVITTEWGGQLDFCTKENSWLIDFIYQRADTHFEIFDSTWADPDEGDLANIMKDVYFTPEALRKIKAHSGQKLLRENFTWKQVARKNVLSVRRWVADSHQPNLNIGWVSTWNVKCGISGYSENLVRHLPGNITVFAGHSTSKTKKDEGNVERCWLPGDHDPLKDLRSAVEKRNIDTLVIQFNYGFFDFTQFSDFLQEQIEAGRTVIVTLHSTVDPEHYPKKQLVNLSAILAKCHRILVHSINDLNRLKKLGLVQNVAILPHGILSSGTNVNKIDRKSKITIASYGFFLPHKGLGELVDAISILREQNVDASLMMYNAEYPVPISRDLIRDIKQKIKSLGLDDVITMVTDFQTDEESLNYLSQADLIVYPYQNTGESSSAAVRHGIATGRPVLVTPLAIFDDVRPAVNYLPGTSSLQIAEGIKHFITNTLEAGLEPEKTRTAQLWREAHLYSNVGKRLYGMLIGLHRQNRELKYSVGCLELAELKQTL